MKTNVLPCFGKSSLSQVCEGSVVERWENKAKYISETYVLAQLLTKGTASSSFMPYIALFHGTGEESSIHR